MYRPSSLLAESTPFPAPSLSLSVCLLCLCLFLCISPSPLQFDSAAQLTRRSLRLPFGRPYDILWEPSAIRTFDFYLAPPALDSFSLPHILDSPSHVLHRSPR